MNTPASTCHCFNIKAEYQVISICCKLYILAVIYELMNGHTHLSHSFVINAFSLKLLKDRQNIGDLPFPIHSPCVQERSVNFLSDRLYVARPS